MYSSVLRSLSIENFAPFAERVDFTTVTDASKSEHIDNTFKCGDNRYNKVSFLYGANGAGKTFFCRAVREIQRFIQWSPFTIAPSNARALALRQMVDFDQPAMPFAFDTAYVDLPTKFAIEILLDETIYHYEFAVLGQKIISELLTKKYRRTEKLLERTSSSYKSIMLRAELKSFESSKHIVKEEALCLPVAAMHNNIMAERVYNAINEISVVNMTAPRIDPVPNQDAFSRQRMDVYTQALKKANPMLKRVDAEFKSEDLPLLKESGDDFENREFVATKTTVSIAPTYTVMDDGVETEDTPIDFFQDESLGTVKLFTMLPHIYDTLKTGSVLIVDEIDNGFHLSLVKDIIHLFTNQETNPNNAQLICTSHQPLLVNENVRRDQVWIVRKDEQGKSSFHRMSEQKASRISNNLTNKILQGVFDCNPESFFER